MFRDSGVRHLIDSAVKGFSATIFAYGPTGSGKTFSIAGVIDPTPNFNAGFVY